MLFVVVRVPSVVHYLSFVVVYRLLTYIDCCCFAFVVVLLNMLIVVLGHVSVVVGYVVFVVGQ